MTKTLEEHLDEIRSVGTLSDILSRKSGSDVICYQVMTLYRMGGIDEVQALMLALVLTMEDRDMIEGKLRDFVLKHPNPVMMVGEG